MSNVTMQAVRAHDYGGPEVITVEEAPRPAPGTGQVLVRVRAAGVNPADWKMRQGYYRQFMPLTFPWTPGLEGAGVVETVGPDVTTLKAGDHVFGFLMGGYAEYALANANELVVKPQSLSFQEAASIPVGALTAWQAVEDAGITPGQRVLVHGGAGGVGLYAVQLAKAKGAHVIATTSAANADFARSLGADEVIDYGTTKFEDVVKNVDAVIDTVGGDVIERSFGVIKPEGVFITAAGRVDPEAGQSRGIRAASAMRAAPDKLQRISELVQANKLKTQVGKVLPLSQARQAHELSQTGHGRGRIVLQTA